MISKWAKRYLKPVLVLSALNLMLVSFIVLAMEKDPRREEELRIKSRAVQFLEEAKYHPEVTHTKRVAVAIALGFKNYPQVEKLLNN